LSFSLYCALVVWCSTISHFSSFTWRSLSRTFHKPYGIKRSIFAEQRTIAWLACNIIIGQSFAFLILFFTSIYYCIIVKLI